jgi:hypothetical protein
MNLFIRKELRLLMLPWFLALGVVVVPVWVPLRLGWIGAIFLALASFGQELNHGTFSSLLAQSLARARIWWTKVALLGAALISVAAVAGVSFLFWQGLVPGDSRPKDFAELQSVVLYATAICTGGLWTSLLFRQTLPAFWFTLLIPLVITSGSGLLTGFLLPGAVTQLVNVLLIGYSVGGFLFARRLFLNAEDVSFTGGAIALPSWRGAARSAGAKARPLGSACAALLWKEFQLHQIGLLLALGLAVLQLIFFGLIKMRSSTPDPYWSLHTTWGDFWFVLWFALPFLIGSLAVAEERRLGTLESHLCLPMALRVQLLLKFLVALFLGIVVGAAIPWALDEFGQWIDAPMNRFPAAALGSRIVITAVILALSFYASTLTRNLLQALGVAIVLCWILPAFFVLAKGGFYLWALHLLFPRGLWQGPLGTIICLAVMLTMLAWLAFRNYRHVLVGWRIWEQNLKALCAAMLAVVLGTTAIYHRAWEFITPLESRHGTARFTPSQAPGLKSAFEQVAGLFPDGRVWISYFSFSSSGELIRNSLGRGSFIAGTSYRTVALSGRQLVAIQTNGTLWAARRERSQLTIQPKNIGLDTNWVSAAGMTTGFLLLKNDGSLWGWGMNGSSSDISTTSPVRAGPENNWVAVFQSGWQAFARQQDGRVWNIVVVQDQSNSEVRIERRPDLEETNSISFSLSSHGTISLLHDGTLWVRAAPDPSYETLAGATSEFPIRAANKHRFGPDTTWKSFSANWADPAVSIRDDGTLWRWRWGRWESPAGEQLWFNRRWRGQEQLGTHSDWVAAVATWDGIFSLAADGTLWHWENPDPNQSGWVAPSRKPKKIADLSSPAK